MTDTTRRDITPVTGEGWRRLGFYHELDPDERSWRLTGSRAGLVGLARLIRRYVETSTNSPSARPMSLGPYDDLQIRRWERPGIDDESIYGGADDLERLAGLIDQRLAEVTPGTTVSIGTEYAHDAEFVLVFEVMEDDFDPGDVPAVAPDWAPPAESDAPPLAFQFHDTESRGVITLGERDLLLQFERNDFAAVVGKIRDAFVGERRSHVEDLAIPLAVVSRVRFKRGLFWADLQVYVQDLKLIEGVPAAKAGMLRLRFARADRDDAEDLAAAISEQLDVPF